MQAVQNFFLTSRNDSSSSIEKTGDFLFTGTKEKEFTSQIYFDLIHESTLTYLLYPRGRIERQLSNKTQERIEIYNKSQ